MTIGCVFVIGILVFLVWFGLQNRERQEEGGSIFGVNAAALLLDAAA